MDKTILGIEVNMLILLLFFVATGVGIYLFYKYRVNSQKSIGDSKAQNIAIREKLEREVEQEIEQMRSNLFENALCYYIETNYRKYNLSDAKIEELREKYPQILAKPFIDWTAVNLRDERSYIYEEKLQNLLDLKEAETFSKLKSKFAEQILNDAQLEANKILNRTGKTILK